MSDDTPSGFLQVLEDNDTLATTTWTILWAIVWLRITYLISVTWQFTTDDAYISLRYARNMADGHGLVFNPGDGAVEGYSNFLFVLVGAGSVELGLDPILVFKVLGVVAVVATLVVVYRLARQWLPPLAAMIAPLLATAHPGLALWSVSGLETSVYVAATAGTVLLAVHCLTLEDEANKSRWYLGLGLATFFLSLIRPEGPIVGVMVFLAIAWRARVRGKATDQRPRDTDAGRGLLLFIASFAIPLVVYFAWRLYYFGHVLPNSVRCKALYEGDPFELIRDFITSWKWMLAAALLIPLRRWGAHLLMLLGIPAAYIGILYGADPLVGYNDRHFLAAFALLTVPAAIGIANVVHIPFGNWLSGRALGLAAFAASLTFVGPTNLAAGHSLSEWVAFYETRTTAREKASHWLNEHLEPGEAYLIPDAGLVPYRTPNPVIDAYCLNSKAFHNSPVNGDYANYVDWVLEKSPKAIVVISKQSDQLVPWDRYGFQPRLLEHPYFRKTYTARTSLGVTGGDYHFWVFTRNGSGSNSS